MPCGRRPGPTVLVLRRAGSHQEVHVGVQETRGVRSVSSRSRTEPSHEIFLGLDITDEQLLALDESVIVELVRCGVRYDNDGLCMFV